MSKHTISNTPVIIENNGFRLTFVPIKRITVYISKKDIKDTPVSPWKPIITATLRKFPELGDTIEIDQTPPKILSNRPRVVIYFLAKPSVRYWFKLTETASRCMSIYIRYHLGFKMIPPFNIIALLYKEEFKEIA